MSVTLETDLAKSERAPFDGVLVPYPQYYYYNEQVELNFEREVQDSVCSSCAGESFWSSLIVGSLALSVGLYLGSPK